ncbi:hypothetical protein VSH64_34445 [Amycolatopsis rhabdoformis]|uniref:Pycsar effector protein domain-containing protein n=1 Tax=Amycolatopsis rhabdoformis TaxID=1448059 RepID=A0ABZ1I2L4_9PSEU|nr:hypothetical protein [Amycolatopsis rhabdoformis]WSE27919.1 hypothetical protein VSH64_34445 [Amycolatopsis rhabdoformis]
MTTHDVMPQVHRAHEQARDELRRADTKITTLLSLVGAALAGVVALTTRDVSVPATVALWFAATPIFASVLVLLAAVRPRLSQYPAPGSWLDSVYNGPAVLLEASSVVASESLAADASTVGAIAVRKYRQIGNAVALLVMGLCVLAVALVLAVLT